MLFKDMSLLTAGLAGLALLGGTRSAHAQVLPGDMDKTQIRPSAYGLGIGGSYLLLGDDPNGLISNPAAVANVRADSRARTAADGLRRSQSATLYPESGSRRGPGSGARTSTGRRPGGSAASSAAPPFPSCTLACSSTTIACVTRCLYCVTVVVRPPPSA